MAKVVIAGLGKYLPKRVVTNEEIVRIFRKHGITKTTSGKPLTPEWIEGLIGINTRHWAHPSQNTSDLALHAAKPALKMAGISWRDLDVIRIGSSSPESFYPSTACWALHKVHGPRIEAADVLAACTSGLFAMVDVKRALMDEEDYQYGLAIGAEVLATRMTDFSDVHADLWGDGAGVVVLKKVADEETDSGIICSILGSDPEVAPLAQSIGFGTRRQDLQGKRNILLRGHDVQRFVLTIIPELIVRTIEKANRIFKRSGKSLITLENIKLFCVHQANGRIFEKPAKKLGIPLEKFYLNVDRYGNTSSASVLICLAEAVEEGRVAAGDLVMLISFGGGITWGSILLRL